MINPLQMEFCEKGAAAVSVKEKAGVCQNHGVYLGDQQGYVRRFLHKKSVEVLTEAGAVDSRGKADIDTGAVLFSGEMVRDLYSLVSEEEDFRIFVNGRTRLSFYIDFLYPLASDSTRASYLGEQPEGEFTPELMSAREKLWAILRPYRLVQSGIISAFRYGGRAAGADDAKNGGLYGSGLVCLREQQLPERSCGGISCICRPGSLDRGWDASGILRDPE